MEEFHALYIVVLFFRVKVDSGLGLGEPLSTVNDVWNGGTDGKDGACAMLRRAAKVSTETSTQSKKYSKSCINAFPFFVTRAPEKLLLNYVEKLSFYSNKQ